MKILSLVLLLFSVYGFAETNIDKEREVKLTVEIIKTTKDDKLLGDLISKEINRHQKMFGKIQSDEDYLKFIQSLPEGLRAMASVYDLDVSMTLDDLGWHFANHYSWEFALETLNGLIEIGATEEATIFEQSLKVLKKNWLKLGAGIKLEGEKFTDWYYESSYYKEMEPYDSKLSELFHENKHGFLSYWVDYSRKNPNKLFK